MEVVTMEGGMKVAERGMSGGGGGDSVVSGGVDGIAADLGLGVVVWN